MVGFQLVTETSILSYFIVVIPSSKDPSYRYANLSVVNGFNICILLRCKCLSNYIFSLIVFATEPVTRSGTPIFLRRCLDCETLPPA